MEPRKFYLTPADLTFEEVQAILENNIRIELSDESERRIQMSKDYLDRKLEASDKPIYGINTGFGALCDIEISNSDLSRLQENLILSHACNLGPEVPSDVVKLMLLLKAHALWRKVILLFSLLLSSGSSICLTMEFFLLYVSRGHWEPAAIWRHWPCCFCLCWDWAR
jgi:hypothetical protein